MVSNNALYMVNLILASPYLHLKTGFVFICQRLGLGEGEIAYKDVVVDVI